MYAFHVKMQVQKCLLQRKKSSEDKQNLECTLPALLYSISHHLFSAYIAVLVKSPVHVHNYQQCHVIQDRVLSQSNSDSEMFSTDMTDR